MTCCGKRTRYYALPEGGPGARKLGSVAISDPTLTLAGLRRSRTAKPRSQPGGPGLFDLLGPELTEDEEARVPSAATAPAVLEAENLPAAQETAESLMRPGATAEPLALVPPEVVASSQVLEAIEAGALPLSSEDTPRPVPQTWSVSGIVRHVRELVERGYSRVTVEGEISNWRPAGSGHCYFTVKDAGAQLSAVMFRRQASLIRFQPRDGDAVKLHGQLSIYESRGQMQLIVEWMQQAGLGALLAEVQRLKEQLRREGVFENKRPLPPFPRCIGVITSLQGAALRDIIKVCRRRHAAVQLLIYPAAVQGPNCPAEIAAGLRWFAAHMDQAEVLLVARGGGSWEDLHGFDHEQVARAIAASPLPVITGIGHATDTTIADAAADLCAPTPSAAAELLTAAQHRVEERMVSLHSRLLRAGSFELLRAQQRLGRLGAQMVLRRVEDGLNRRAQRLDELGFRSFNGLDRRLRLRLSRLQGADARLQRCHPGLQLQNSRQRMDGLRSRLELAMRLRLTATERRREAASTRLDALSPLRVLDRGYALVYGSDGHLLRSAGAVAAGEEISARLGEGVVRARVIDAIA